MAQGEKVFGDLSLGTSHESLNCPKLGVGGGTLSWMEEILHHRIYLHPRNYSIMGFAGSAIFPSITVGTILVGYVVSTVPYCRDLL